MGITAFFKNLASEALPGLFESSIGPIINTKGSSWDDIVLRGANPEGSLVTCQNPYNGYIWAYKGIKANARSVNQCPFELHNRSTKELVENHWLNHVFQWVNPQLSGKMLWEVFITWLMIRGEVFVVPWGDDPKHPTELYLPDPKYFTEKKNAEGHILHWQYSPEGFKGKPVILQPEQLIHHFFFNPQNPCRGLSPLDPAAKSISTDWRAIHLTQRIFDNNAVPGIVLSAPGALDPAQRKQIRAAWEERHQGVANVNRVALTWGGMDVKTIGYNFKDMALPDLRRMSLTEVLAALDVPPVVVGVTDNMNFGTSQEQRSGWWNDTLLPLMEGIADRFNSNFFPLYAPELYCTFNVSRVPELQEDMRQKVVQAEKLFRIGFTPKQINEKLQLGFDERPWHDMIFVQQGLVKITDVLEGKVPASPPPPDGAKKEVNSEAHGALTAEGTLSPALIAAYADDAAAVLRLFQKHEVIFLKAIKEYFFGLRVRQLKRIPEDQKDYTIEDQQQVEELLFILDEESKRLRLTTDPLIINAMREAGEAAIMQIGSGVTFNMNDPFLMAELDLRCTQITGIVRTVREQLKVQLLQGISNGENMSRLADRIKQVMRTASSRAMTIARTETGHAFGPARYAANQQSDVERHIWFTARDEVVRNTHRMCHGVIVPMGQFFPNGLLFPGDMAHDMTGKETINCRCVELAVK